MPDWTYNADCRDALSGGRIDRNRHIIAGGSARSHDAANRDRPGPKAIFVNLNAVDAELPPDKAVHVILDNYATHKQPKVRAWLDRHPRWTFHVVPTSPESIEWLSDNGSCYTARDTRAFARDIGLIPCTTPVSSPQSNGMAEAFARTLKRVYVGVNPTPDARTVIE